MGEDRMDCREDAIQGQILAELLGTMVICEVQVV